MTTNHFHPHNTKKFCVGIDVSHHQNGPDGPLIDKYQILRNPPDFFLYRAGDGIDRDTELAHFEDIAVSLEEEHGTPHGRYLMYRARREEEKQLDILLDGPCSPLGYYADFEPVHAWLGMDRKPLADWVVINNFAEFLRFGDKRTSQLELYGYWGFKKIARAVLNGVGWKYSSYHSRTRRLWVPDYPAIDGKPGTRRQAAGAGWYQKFSLPLGYEENAWTFHQVSSRGNWPGIEGPVDINLFNGPVAKLKETFPIARPPESEKDPNKESLIKFLRDLGGTVESSVNTLRALEDNISNLVESVGRLESSLWEKVHQLESEE